VQKNVDTLIEIKLEKHKNLWEESRFYWGEIEDGTLTFDRPQVEVCVHPHLCMSFLRQFLHEHIHQ
jgi:insulysin